MHWSTIPYLKKKLNSNVNAYIYCYISRKPLQIRFKLVDVAALIHHEFNDQVQELTCCVEWWGGRQVSRVQTLWKWLHWDYYIIKKGKKYLNCYSANRKAEFSSIIEKLNKRKWRSVRCTWHIWQGNVTYMFQGNHRRSTGCGLRWDMPDDCSNRGSSFSPYLG